MLAALPPPMVMSHAMSAVDRFGDPRQVLIVVDMREPNVDRRMWVIDLETDTIVLQTRVAHGSGSDPDHSGVAHRFGNREGSFMTSLGAYRVGSAYQGHSGLAYQLVGLSPSNSNAEERDIMLHRASYVSPTRVGWSQGCLAISPTAFVDLQHRLGDLSDALIWVDGPGVVPPSVPSWPVWSSSIIRPLQPFGPSSLAVPLWREASWITARSCSPGGLDFSLT